MSCSSTILRERSLAPNVAPVRDGALGQSDVHDAGSSRWRRRVRSPPRPSRGARRRARARPRARRRFRPRAGPTRDRRRPKARGRPRCRCTVRNATPPAQSGWPGAPRALPRSARRARSRRSARAPRPARRRARWRSAPIMLSFGAQRCAALAPPTTRSRGSRSPSRPCALR